jgi:hypothetical protein
LVFIGSRPIYYKLSCVNEAGIAVTPSCINPRKRALSGSDIPPVDSSESLSEIANIDIKRARKRAQSGQQVQADSLTKNTRIKMSRAFPRVLATELCRGPPKDIEVKFVLNNGRNKFSFSCPCWLRCFSTLPLDELLNTGGNL